MIRTAIVYGMAIVSLLAACSAPAADLLVSAAASLTNAFSTLKPAFEAAAPGTTLTCNFGASGSLLHQIALGAPVDVFVAADMQSMDDAVAKNLVDPSSRTTFARNQLVLAIPRDDGKIHALDDLKTSAIARIGIGNSETVPAGRYARAALEKANLWQELQPKLVMAESVRQVLEYLQRGEVDAGFIYATDAYLARERVAVAATIAIQPPVLYPAAATADAKNRVEADKFLAFLGSAEGQAILATFGFSKP